MSDSEFLEDAINEVDDSLYNANHIVSSLETAMSVECLDDLLGNLSDARFYIKELDKTLSLLHKKVKAKVERKDK